MEGVMVNKELLDMFKQKSTKYSYNCLYNMGD